jgi:hypothetical protein
MGQTNSMISKNIRISDSINQFEENINQFIANEKGAKKKTVNFNLDCLSSFGINEMDKKVLYLSYNLIKIDIENVGIVSFMKFDHLILNKKKLLFLFFYSLKEF